ncbi:MAG: flavin-dependent oxidoreductase, partial [Proteobacteria bacterium]|nr:flavin-dependent oxidoreductase [Pseudomonadota bacterium]
DHLIKMFFDYYRERADHYGYTASPYQMRHLVSVYVAETDEQAEAETAQHVLWHYHKGLRHKWEQFFPPGYATPQAMRRIIENAGELDFPSFSFKQLNEKGYCIVGSVNTVRERIAQYSRDLGFGLFLALTHFGGLPNARCRGSMEPLASEVMPSLRAEFAHMV